MNADVNEGGTHTVAELRRQLGQQLKTCRTAAGVTQEQLSTATRRHRTAISHYESGKAPADAQFWEAADELCNTEGALTRAFREVVQAQQNQDPATRTQRLRQAQHDTAFTVSRVGYGTEDDELEALELARRIARSDVGDATLTRLELATDDLAIAYTVTSPEIVLTEVRRYLHYTSTLLDARATLAQQRRLLVNAGWLSLLAATLHIDLTHMTAANAQVQTAASLADHAGHQEIKAWCYETEAWRMLTGGAYHRAVDLSRRARALAPTGTSIAIQAAAQESRAHARLRNRPDTYAAIDRVQSLSSAVPMREGPEHHFRYDSTRSMADTATALAWLGDPDAERYSREVIDRLSSGADPARWPRRVASTKLDLALSLLATDRLEEACAVTRQALESGQVARSNHWRAAEILVGVEICGLPQASDLREAYEQLRRHLPVSANLTPHSRTARRH